MDEDCKPEYWPLEVMHASVLLEVYIVTLFVLYYYQNSISPVIQNA